MVIVLGRDTAYIVLMVSGVEEMGKKLLFQSRETDAGGKGCERLLEKTTIVHGFQGTQFETKLFRSDELRNPDRKGYGSRQ